MPIGTVPFTARDGTLLLQDNADAHTFTVAYEDGSFSMNVPGKAVNAFLDRGDYPSAGLGLRYGESQPITFSFNAVLRDLSDATYATLASIAAWCTGAATVSYVETNWVSRGGANAEVNTIEIVWTVTDPTAASHTCSLDYSHVTISLSEGFPFTTLAMSGTSYTVAPVLT